MFYKPNEFARRYVNCQARLDGNQELSSTDLVQVRFYSKPDYTPELPDLSMVDISKDGIKLFTCNIEFFKAQFKPA